MKTLDFDSLCRTSSTIGNVYFSCTRARFRHIWSTKIRTFLRPAFRTGTIGAHHSVASVTGSIMSSDFMLSMLYDVVWIIKSCEAIYNNYVKLSTCGGHDTATTPRMRVVWAMGQLLVDNYQPLNVPNPNVLAWGQSGLVSSPVVVVEVGTSCGPCTPLPFPVVWAYQGASTGDFEAW